MWRLRGRSSFSALHAEGRRVRRGPVSVTYRPAADPSAPPRVAYAVGRAVGSAVVRNRVRRRLRAAVHELGPRPGDYLVGASPAAAQATFPQLRAHLGSAFDALVGR